MELREYRQVKTMLNLTYDTPVEKIEGFVEGVKQMLENHPATHKDIIQVFLYEFGFHSLDILLNFFLQVPDREAELIKRQEILLDILRLAEARGIRFAFPTQTLHIESLPEEKPDTPNPTALFPKDTWKKRHLFFALDQVRVPWKTILLSMVNFYASSAGQ